MTAEVFLDTNVLVYSFDPSAPAKQAKARHLLSTPRWSVSWQVIQEFSNVALHRFATPMTPADLQDYVQLILWPRCRVLPSLALHEAAVHLHRQTQFRFYDCLVVASALASGATTLFSEDLQTGRRIGPMTIINPFAP
jgi:predicted nucleic acid-binding protein